MDLKFARLARLRVLPLTGAIEPGFRHPVYNPRVLQQHCNRYLACADTDDTRSDGVPFRRPFGWGGVGRGLIARWLGGWRERCGRRGLEELPSFNWLSKPAPRSLRLCRGRPNRLLALEVIDLGLEGQSRNVRPKGLLKLLQEAGISLFLLLKLRVQFLQLR